MQRALYLPQDVWVLTFWQNLSVFIWRLWSNLQIDDFRPPAPMFPVFWDSRWYLPRMVLLANGIWPTSVNKMALTWCLKFKPRTLHTILSMGQILRMNNVIDPNSPLEDFSCLPVRCKLGIIFFILVTFQLSSVLPSHSTIYSTNDWKFNFPDAFLSFTSSERHVSFLLAME